MTEALYEDDGWRWPFLIMSAMFGADVRSIGETIDRGSIERVASFVGSTTRHLHDLPVVERDPLVHSTFADLINDRMAKSGRDHVSWDPSPSCSPRAFDTTCGSGASSSTPTAHPDN